MSKKWYLAMMLAVAGSFLSFGEVHAQAKGKFTIQVVELNGNPIPNDAIKLEIQDGAGNAVMITPTGGAPASSMTVMNGNFSFSIAPTTNDVTLYFFRGNTPRTIPSLHGNSVRTQNFQITIGPKS